MFLTIYDHHAAHRPGGQPAGRLAGEAARHLLAASSSCQAWRGAFPVPVHVSRSKSTPTPRRWASPAGCSLSCSSPSGGRRSARSHLGQVQGAAQLLTVFALGGRAARARRPSAWRLGVLRSRCVQYLAVGGRRLRAGRLACSAPERRPTPGEDAPHDRTALAAPRHGLRVRHGLRSRRVRSSSAGCSTPTRWPPRRAKPIACSERRRLNRRKNLRCRWQTNVFTGECTFETFDPVIDLGPVCRQLAHDPRLLAVLRDLYGEPACLFKDKLILQAAGREGLRPAPGLDRLAGLPAQLPDGAGPVRPAPTATTAAPWSIPATTSTAACSAQDGQYHELPAETVDESKAVPLELEPGDVAIFGGFTPHRSDPNVSDRWRRQLYLSYNELSDGGDQRDRALREFHALAAEEVRRARQERTVLRVTDPRTT